MKANRPMSNTAAAVAVIAAALLLPGCSRESEPELLESARSFIAAQDLRSATIQLKTLLQRNPQSAPARLLLGKTLLESGEAGSAAVELGKARELGASADEVVPELARAWLASGEHAKIVAQFAQTQLQAAPAQADLLTSLAAAHAIKGESDDALELTRRALAAQPGFAPAQLLQARLVASQGDTDAALRLVEEVLGREPSHARANLIKGELLWHARRDAGPALAALRGAVQADPKLVAAYVAQAAILSSQGKAGEIPPLAAALEKVAPHHPDSLLLQAQVAYAEGRLGVARDLCARVLKSMPDNARVLLLAGATEYRLKSYLQAQNHLARALRQIPDHVPARQLLAQAHLQIGQPARAIEVLEPVIQGPRADGVSLATAGEAQMQAGDLKRADEMFRRAAQAAPEDTRVRTTLALARLARGDTVSALAELESAAAADKGTRADLALISARMRVQDRAGALRAIDSLALKIPERALPELLRGRILALANDAAGASAAFQAALKKEPRHFPAISGLAALDLAAGKPDLARQRMETMIKAEPSHAQAHLALAEIVARSGGTPAEVSKALAAAVKAAPESPTARLALIEHSLRSGDTAAALAAAQDANAAITNDLALVDALGRAQMASGDAHQAVGTFSRLAGLNPRLAQVHLRLADAQMLSQDAAGARRTLKKALELDPENFAARRSLVAVALEQGQVDEARTLARALQKAKPKDFNGFMLEGDIERQQRNWQAASVAYRSAQRLAPSSDLAIRLHQALIQSGQRAEAERTATSWQQDHAQDAGFRYHLGDVAMAQGDHAGAEAHYRAVLAAQPRNALAMNNIAWLMARQGKPGAVKLAEEALKILPGRSTLLDTLATALAAENDVARAVETQQRAVAAGRDEPALRLNLARLLLRAGSKAQARTELQALAGLGDKFAGQREVAELLQAAR